MFVEFIVETNGVISNVNIAKGVNEYLDDEAIRVFLQTQSKWIPAVSNGQVVKQKLVLPITFTMGDPNQNASFTYFDLTNKIEEDKAEKAELNEIVVVGQSSKKN